MSNVFMDDDLREEPEPRPVKEIQRQASDYMKRYLAKHPEIEVDSKRYRELWDLFVFHATHDEANWGANYEYALHYDDVVRHEWGGHVYTEAWGYDETIEIYEAVHGFGLLALPVEEA